MRHRDDSIERILAYIDRHGVVDKDKQKTAATPPRRSRKRKRVTGRATLDLHGMVSDEAARRLRAAVKRCRGSGMRELLIIHGQGHHSGEQGPVLKRMVRRMLAGELQGQVRDFVTAAPRDGGGGATIVRLG
jgi:DNA-nicking Smr family endonuclease